MDDEVKRNREWLPRTREAIPKAGTTIPLLEALIWVGAGRYFELEWPPGQPPKVGRAFDRAYRARKLRPEPTKPFDLNALGFASSTKLALKEFHGRNAHAETRRLCKSAIPNARLARFGQCVLAPAERALFDECRIGRVGVYARISETEIESCRLSASYFDCPIAINAHTGHLEFDAASPIEIYFKWRHGEGLTRYGPKVDLKELLEAFPCEPDKAHRMNGSGRRAANSTDKREFREWVSSFYADNGRPATREESYRWASARGLGQSFVRRMRQLLPAELKFARGEKP